MSAFVIPAPPTPSVAVAGSTHRFPVRRIVCVGRNYAAHAREMGSDPDREPPFFFAKPADAVVDDGATLPFPPDTADLHHEVELVVAIGTGGRDIPVAQALDHVWGYAIGNDLTRRDLQKAAKAKGRPWALAKGFDASAPVGPVHPVAAVGHPSKGAVTCTVDGVERQRGDLGDLIWSVAEVIAQLSATVALAPGDLIFTGTPAGVGPLERGSTCVCAIEGLGTLTTRLAPARP